MDFSEVCLKLNQLLMLLIILLINVIIVINVIIIVVIFVVIFSLVIVFVVVVLIMFFGGVLVKERLLKEICEDFVVGFNRWVNKILSGIVINDVVSRYFIGMFSVV